MATVGLITPAMQQQHQPSSQLEEPRQDLPRPYKCHICSKAFHRLEHQTRHIRTHTGEKPHVCQFPGCTKRFSRSDELTRHTRIHNNPNSRRGKGQQQHHAAAALQAAVAQEAARSDSANAAQANSLSRSAPTSNLASPNVSPPNSYVPYIPQSSNALPPFGRSGSHSAGGSPNALQQPLDNVNLLVSAASQIERGSPHMAYTSRHHNTHTHLTHPYLSTSTPRMTGLAQYSLSHPMGRTHSHEADDPYSHRITKKSRPNSPYSTAPPSPTFSHDSTSPTPDHTPLATPAHSPRLRAAGWTDIQLPHLRQLSLHHAPALAPMEPHAETTAAFAAGGAEAHGMRISDIMMKTDSSHRKLPMPRVAVQDLLNNGPGFVSGPSSSAGSIAGNDLMERS